MPYSAEINRANPTCFLFMIDQSLSMQKPMAGDPNRSKAEAVADTVNELLYALVFRCVAGTSVLDRLHVGVIGYGAQVGPAFGAALAYRDIVPISQLAANPLRVEDKLKQQPDGSFQPVRFPIWFEPIANGNTPMGEAMDRAGMLVSGFLAEHPHCFPPIVINITDGKPTDRNPKDDAERLKQLYSSDGYVLLFNLHISETSGQKIVFPDNEAYLPDQFARLLFRMSSILPPTMARTAYDHGFPVTQASRGCVFNGDLDTVVASLDIGTSAARNKK